MGKCGHKVEFGVNICFLCWNKWMPKAYRKLAYAINFIRFYKVRRLNSHLFKKLKNKNYHL